MTKITTLCPEINLAQRKALLRELESLLPEKAIVVTPKNIGTWQSSLDEGLTRAFNSALDQVTQALREYIVGSAE